MLYHSGRDGLNGESFHRNCDNKGATIWVAKIQGSTQLIGGYNPLDWDGHSYWKNTADSFLFNFTDGKDISTVKLGYVNDASKAVHCYICHGPYMGNLHTNGSNDWRFGNYNGGYIYPDIGIPANFTVEEYEVFQVIKK